MTGLGVQEGTENLPRPGPGRSYRLFVGQPQGAVAFDEAIGRGKREASVNSLQPLSSFVMTGTLVKDVAGEIELEWEAPLHIEDALYGTVLHNLPSGFAQKAPPRLKWIGRPTGRDIDRQLGPNDLFTELVPCPTTEIDEEEIHVYPTMAFGTRPIPRSSRRIRLTPRIRAAIPDQRLPRSFSLAPPEEPEE